MEIIRTPIPLAHLEALAAGMFGDLVKAVVDVGQGIMVVGGELHADEEALLITEGSSQRHLWGINLHPDQHGGSDFIEFDSMINIRPSQGNRSRWVDDAAIRVEIAEIVARLVE
ncbi:MAG: DUF5674 family protein [Chloroflexota bacterium]